MLQVALFSHHDFIYYIAGMASKNSANSFHSTKRRRKYEESIVVIPMDDDQAHTQDEVSVAMPPCSFTGTSLFKAMKPLLVSCFVAGLLSRKRLNKTGFRKYLTFTCIYSTLVLIILTAQGIRSLTMFERTDEFGSVLFFKLVYVAWTMEALGHFAGFYVATFIHDRLPKFFLEWEKFRKDCAGYPASITNLTKTCTAVVWILVIFFVGFNSYLAICTQTFTVLLTSFNLEQPYATVMVVLNMVAECYLNFAWMAQSALMFVFCKTLANGFHQIKQRINDQNLKGHITLNRDLELVRQHHNALCSLVGYADNLFSMQIAGSFAGSVLMTCMISYILMMGDSGTVLTLTHALYLLTAVVKMVTDCISGAMVNEAVSHRSLILLT